VTEFKIEKGSRFRMRTEGTVATVLDVFPEDNAVQVQIQFPGIADTYTILNLNQVKRRLQDGTYRAL